MIPYKPRALQRELHGKFRRFNVLVCHRRFGKTVMCVNELIKGAVTCQLERPRFAYIAPLFRQSKQVAWDYLKHYTSVIEGREAHEAELRVDLPNQARIQLFGADNPDALRGMYLDGVVMDEFGQMRPRVWSEIVRPMLVDRNGKAIFIGTPFGRNEFFELYEGASSGQFGPDWFTAIYRASETGIVSEAELSAAKLVMSKAQYDQEFECSFEAAIQGAYYGELIAKAQAEGRIRAVAHQPGLKVETWWDLGFADPTAIWFVQRTPRETHVIDYWEESGKSLSDIAVVLQQKQQTLGYVYGTHVWPHDGKAHEQATGKRLDETMEGMGFRVEINGNDEIGPGIDAVRQLIPLCWFDGEKCKRGLETLRNYRAEYDEEKKTFKPRPLHDWASHGADAFRTGAMHRPVFGAGRKIVYPKQGVI